MDNSENFKKWYEELTKREPLLKELIKLGFLNVVQCFINEGVPTLLSYNLKRKEFFGDVEIIW